MRKFAKTDAGKYLMGSPARASVIVVLALAWLCAPLTQKAHAGSTQTPWQNLTPSKLSAVHWQWLFSVPASQSPVNDPTGHNAFNGQPYSDLVFLAGTFAVQQLINGDVLGQVTRAISVKQGTALFYPLLDAEVDNVCARPNLGGNCFGKKKFPYNQGVPALTAAVLALIDPVTGLHSQITPCTDAGFTSCTRTVNVAYARLQSPPFNFTLPPAPDNLFGFQGINNVSGKVAPVVSDGYFSLVPLGRLTPGYYKLEFGEKVPVNSVPNYFIQDITYNITVTP